MGLAEGNTEMHLLVVMEVVKGRRNERHCCGHEPDHDTHGRAYQL